MNHYLTLVEHDTCLCICTSHVWGRSLVLGYPVTYLCCIPAHEQTHAYEYNLKIPTRNAVVKVAVE